MTYANYPEEFSKYFAPKPKPNPDPTSPDPEYWPSCLRSHSHPSQCQKAVIKAKTFDDIGTENNIVS